MLQVTHINVGYGTGHVKFLLSTHRCYNDLVDSVLYFFLHLHINGCLGVLEENLNLLETNVCEDKSLILLCSNLVLSFVIGNSTKSWVVFSTDVGTDNRFTVCVCDRTGYDQFFLSQGIRCDAQHHK